MVFKRVKSVLFKIFKRGHPDIYDALKDYCDKHGYNMSDVVASAVASFLAVDEEGKQELIEKMSQRRTSGGGSPLQIKETLNLFKDFCGVMKDMFAAMNEARAGMSIQALISDFKAVSQAMNEIKRAGEESGKGTLDDLIASAFVRGFLNRLGVRTNPKNITKSGKGKVINVGEEE